MQSAIVVTTGRHFSVILGNLRTIGEQRNESDGFHDTKCSLLRTWHHKSISLSHKGIYPKQLSP